MPDVLVFGATGQVGRSLLPRLRAAGRSVCAVSRRAPATAGDAAVQWERGDLAGAMPVLPSAAAIVSLGPLDHFAAWFERSGVAPQVVVALGSMSAQSKQTAADPAERELAQRLVAAEERLVRTCAARGTRAVVLRATLIYGGGDDRSLSHYVRIAARTGFFPLLPGARGLRQPVHAEDLAVAVVAALAADAAQGVYPCGGGEQVDYSQMLRRIRAGLTFRTWPLPLPVTLLRLGAALAGRGRGAVARLSADLIADNARARADFGYAPRDFHPDMGCWRIPDDRGVSVGD